MPRYHLVLLLPLFVFCNTALAQRPPVPTSLNSAIGPAKDSLRYALYRPAEDSLGLRPLVVYLHGGGGGTDVGQVSGDGVPKDIYRGTGGGAYVLAPLNRFVRGFWDLQDVNRLIERVIAAYPVDTARIYLTGSSRGGLGAWTLAMQYPDRFAALVPVCGAVPHPYHVWIPDELPIWVFHGADDDAIPTSETVEMIETLRRKGRSAPTKVTYYEGVGHNAWDYAYKETALYEWLLRQRRE